MNVDQSEIAKFSALAHRWWDPNSEFKPLHAINPLRLSWIKSSVNLDGKKVVDIGCGGGILAESIAQSGADTTGIDLSEKALKVAELHALEVGANLTYRAISAEDLAQEQPEQYDVVTCMEMLEHVPDPASVVRACAVLCKPGGTLFFSTLNRSTKSYLFAIIGAEYILRLLPKGTHEYAKFIKPSELLAFTRAAGLELLGMKGLSYNPLTQVYSLNDDVDVNYMIAVRK
ncbi:bifunctional 2-polyprenyl-6-hydroxyphenol methylase/3-demethylubiquinol 3-O-methyltransferase UbiG [Polynucleobacter sp. AP-Latsch-80-C2]|jgi:2-polyprenyl-6-hydroxyphenyl methylase/3-demethylubiquinone-9 3-methyltransferase|uniref:bifunctional 2-polyprenyl-6-hydroxyphenol methylase/3-demethylubiquinol 3-O-methyltransferase UbiG n=1 Tax=Polynucleobacter sp. AP-Latsch-80-C2 TaxID=2576931 RepID=UPI001C0C1B3B|nr:bifunctional 2-polyprenyl-6-hydroxyphenol methylase/3-demethylubiquinol 3-O-methyltransferase UbiG [Polynucleobacter sp. AP-Latsch-80-C2]MBU3622998.1 bifunctional 2-polyprenyl-6-hydroxyphenol methylase/3-demethylubiquinol 3-O-methyltransferase UbiG [Polynucleobacter sp. AP-Latsch-80-C2]